MLNGGQTTGYNGDTVSKRPKTDIDISAVSWYWLIYRSGLELQRWIDWSIDN